MAHEHRYEVPMLSRQERDSRWGKLRQQMGERGLDCLLVYGSGGNLNAQYLSQIGEEGLLVFPLEADPVFLLPSGDRWLHWALGSQDWVHDVRPVRDLPASTGECLDTLRVKRLGLVDVRGLRASAYDGLMRAVSDYETEDASQLLTTFRLVKSEEELAMMNRAAEIAEQAIATLRATAQPGVRANEVHAEVFKTLLAGGCEPASHVAIEVTSHPFHPVRKPTLHVIQPGDVVVTHINPCYAGYYGHPHVPLTIGEPRPEIRDMFRISQEAFETFKAEAKAGVSLGDVCRKVLGVIERAGYDWQKEPLTHSIGLSQNEAPNAGIPANPYPDFELQENQTFGLHPWVGRMADQLGIDSGRPVRITKTGAVPFGPNPSVELFVV